MKAERDWGDVDKRQEYMNLYKACYGKQRPKAVFTGNESAKTIYIKKYDHRSAGRFKKIKAADLWERCV